MKTFLNQKFTSLDELNAKGDQVLISHKYLRARLIAQKYFTPKHKKGLMYLEIEDGKKCLMIAYATIKGTATYAPFTSAPVR